MGNISWKASSFSADQPIFENGTDEFALSASLALRRSLHPKMQYGGAHSGFCMVETSTAYTICRRLRVYKNLVASVVK